MTVTSTTTDETCSTTDTGGQVTADLSGISIACTGGTVVTYSISGSVSDATDNGSVTVYLFLGDDNNIDTSDITAAIATATPDGDGNFSLTDVLENKYYILTAASSTPDEVCSTSDTVSQITADVTDIRVTCVRYFSIDVSITGAIVDFDVTLSLGDDSASLQDERTGNYLYDATAATTSLFTHGGVARDQYYKVSIPTESGFQTCVADNPEGPVTADISVLITCTPKKYKISGTVTGHTGELRLSLQSADTRDNARDDVDDVTVDENTETFTFDYEVPSKHYYSVYISSFFVPNGQTCTFPNKKPESIGTMADQDITLPNISCESAYTITVNITGDARSAPFTLRLDTNGNFRQNLLIDPTDTTKPVPFFTLKEGETYRFSISPSQQPSGMTCRIEGGTDTRTIGTENATVTVNCLNESEK